MTWKNFRPKTIELKCRSDPKANEFNKDGVRRGIGMSRSQVQVSSSMQVQSKFMLVWLVSKMKYH